MKWGLYLVFAVVALQLGFVVFSTDAGPKVAPSGSSMPSTLAAALKSDQPVLVEFYADWCGPCRAVGPEVDALAKEMKGKAAVLRFNVDQHPELAQSYGVRGIPAFIAFKRGKETKRMVGGIRKAQMRAMIN